MLLSVMSTLSVSEDTEWQVSCMQKVVFGSFSERKSRCLAELLEQEDADERDPCRWKGVECRSGSVVNIQWNPRDRLSRTRMQANVIAAYEWFPATVENLEVASQRIAREINTLLLPRNLQICSFNGCALFGRFAIDALPRELRRALCATNRIAGTLSLVHMPPRLEVLDFADNSIECVFIDNAHLPKSFQVCNLSNIRKRARILSSDGCAVDPRIKTYRKKL